MNARMPAALSIDLDNLWTYLRSRGDPRWVDRPSFLPRAVPRVQAVLESCGLHATAFVVGRDAEEPVDADAIRTLLDAGHELGNHSYDHDAGFHAGTAAAIDADFTRSEAALALLGAGKARGFRGPSFRLSRVILETLSARGYDYDASLYPNALGALARAWQRRHFELDPQASAALAGQYGTLRDARAPLAPFRWQLAASRLVEMPVSTLPLLRLPIHFTYLNYLADHSDAVAITYARTHIALCLLRQQGPSLLLHATDFIGADDATCPSFMPGMRRSAAEKLAWMRKVLALYQTAFEVQPLGARFDRLRDQENLTLHEPTQFGLR